MAKQKQRAHRERKEKCMNEHQEQMRAGKAVGRRQRAHSFAPGEEQPTERPQSLSYPPNSREADLCNMILAGLRTGITQNFSGSPPQTFLLRLAVAPCLCRVAGHFSPCWVLLQPGVL